MAVEDNPILMSEIIETVQKINRKLINKTIIGEEYNPGADATLGLEICRLKKRVCGSGNLPQGISKYNLMRSPNKYEIALVI